MPPLWEPPQRSHGAKVAPPAPTWRYALPEVLLLAGAVLLCLSLQAGAQPPQPPITIDSLSHPPRIARTISIRGERIEFLPANAPTPETIPVEELIALSWPNAADPLLENEPANNIPPVTAILEFANGDRLRAILHEMNEEALRATVFGQVLSIPLEQLRGIVWQEETTDDLWWPILRRTEGSADVVLLTNGDRSAGQFTGMSENEVTLLVEGRELNITRERIAAISFSPELVSPPPRPQTWQLVQGSAGWLTIHGIEEESQGELTAKTLFGEEIPLDPTNWTRIRFFGPRVVSLSELEPSTSQHTPWLNQSWTVQPGRSVLNEPLELAGTTYPLGLGMHSQTTHSYDLAGQFETFSVTVGLAPAAGFRGDVSIQVRIDDKILAQRPHWRLADGPIELRDLPVAGGKTLHLEVGFGRNGDIRDLVNWCDPVLVRKPADATPE